VANRRFSAFTSERVRLLKSVELAGVRVAGDGYDGDLAPDPAVPALVARPAQGLELLSSRRILSRALRMSISSLVSPGPLPPMPPVRRRGPSTAPRASAAGT